MREMQKHRWKEYMHAVLNTTNEQPLRFIRPRPYERLGKTPLRYTKHEQRKPTIHGPSEVFHENENAEEKTGARSEEQGKHVMSKEEIQAILAG